MKTVTLTKKEVETILECLNNHNLCRAGCPMDYKTNMCLKMNDKGEWRCKFMRIIYSIEKKLEG